MPLETVNFINDLVETNPRGDLDQRHEGDDHIRNIKKALRNTLPGMNGRAWRTISRSASFSLASTDNMTVNNCAAGITVSASAASSLGNGFFAFLRAPTTGSVTFNPTDNVNGKDAYVVPAGHMAMIFSNGSEFFAVIMYEETPVIPKILPSGTRMLFQQTTAPTGWTKITNSTHNDAALRVVTGSVTTGGTDGFSAHFGTNKSTNPHTLTIAEMPSHTHQMSNLHQAGSGFGDQVEVSSIDNNDGPPYITNATGGGGAHSHGLANFNIKFVDIIVASFD